MFSWHSHNKSDFKIVITISKFVSEIRGHWVQTNLIQTTKFWFIWPQTIIHGIISLTILPRCHVLSTNSITLMYLVRQVLGADRVLLQAAVSWKVQSSSVANTTNTTTAAITITPLYNCFYDASRKMLHLYYNFNIKFCWIREGDIGWHQKSNDRNIRYVRSQQSGSRPGCMVP